MVEEEAEEEVVHEDNDWGISLVSEDAGEVNKFNLVLLFNRIPCLLLNFVQENRNLDPGFFGTHIPEKMKITNVILG